LPPQTSHKTIYKAPDTAVRDEGKGSSLAENQPYASGTKLQTFRASLG